ncbi:MAG: hypothetical protein ACOCUP_00830, partial [bacterium]
MKQFCYSQGLPCNYFRMFSRDLIVLIFVMLFGAANVFANSELQQREITGTVTDASTGVSLPGVNIIIQGTTTG